MYSIRSRLATGFFAELIQLLRTQPGSQVVRQLMA